MRQTAGEPEEFGFSRANLGSHKRAAVLEGKVSSQILVEGGKERKYDEPISEAIPAATPDVRN